MKQFGPALKHLAEIVERGVRDHPELSVGAVTEGVEVKSVGNTPVLKETALIEAFNLKAAIEYVMKNPEATREALTDMPPRSEEELDPVTLHNTALMHMDENPTDGFHKLNFLLQSPPFPPETFGNLLLLYCKPQHAFYDLAADVMAENQALVAKHLPADLYEHLDASILSQTSPEEAYRKYDHLAGKHADELRRLTKKIQDARLRRDSEKIKRAVAEYDDALEAYVPALTAQAKVYWDLEHYQQVERILKQSAEFCGEHETWRLNMAHTYFMQSLRDEEKYGEAIRFYEPIVAAHLEENVLNVTAIVLANLCVAYIMTSQNEEAEELMRRIEKEEERATAENPERLLPPVHRQPRHRDAVLRQGQLRVRHLEGHQIPRALRRQTRDGHVVLRQTMFLESRGGDDEAHRGGEGRDDARDFRLSRRGGEARKGRRRSLRRGRDGRGRGRDANARHGGEDAQEDVPQAERRMRGKYR